MFFLKQLPFFGFFFLLVFICLLIFFSYRARKSLAIYYLAFLALALSCGEIWLWFQTVRDRSATYFEGGYTLNHMSPDRDLGFRLTSGPRRTQSIKRSRNGSLIYDVLYNIDDHGLRRNPQEAVVQKVFFFGDSFTFGEGVADDDTLAAHFSRISGLNTFNFGVHGYGPHQFLRMLETSRPEEMGIREKRPLVVYSLLMTHVDRSAGRAMWDSDGPFYRVTPNGVQFSGPFTRGLIARIANKSYIYKLVAPMMSERADRTRVLEILKAADKIVKDRYGTKMLVVFWDAESRAAYDAPRAQWLRDGFKLAGIATISTSRLAPPLHDAKYYIAGDGHPSASGYAVVAKAIAAYCPGLNCLMPR